MTPKTHKRNTSNTVTRVTQSQQPTVRAWFYAAGQRGPGTLIAQGSERECRRAAASALGRPNLRGCPVVVANGWRFYFEPAPGYDGARAVGLVSGPGPEPHAIE